MTGHPGPRPRRPPTPAKSQEITGGKLNEGAPAAASTIQKALETHLVLLLARLLVPLDNRVQQVDDLLLASRGGVELAAHLDEALVDLRPQICQVLARGVETGLRSLAEVTDLLANCATS